MVRSLRNLVVFASVVGLAVLSGVASSCTPAPPPTPSSATPTPPPGQGPGDDNDRPPIIVSDGSVLLNAVSKDRGMGTNKSRGEWKKDGANWFHDHGGPPAKHLLVTLLYGENQQNRDDKCDDPEWEFDVREMEITYGTIVTSPKFKIFIEDPSGTNPGRLMTDANASQDPKIKFWLKLGTGVDSLKSVRFPTLNVTCKLDGDKGQIHIYQSTK